MFQRCSKVLLNILLGLIFATLAVTAEAGSLRAGAARVLPGPGARDPQNAREMYACMPADVARGSIEPVPRGLELDRVD